MVALKKCRESGVDVSEQVKVCPKCGIKNPVKRRHPFWRAAQASESRHGGQVAGDSLLSPRPDNMKDSRCRTVSPFFLAWIFYPKNYPRTSQGRDGSQFPHADATFCATLREADPRTGSCSTSCLRWIRNPPPSVQSTAQRCRAPPA